jgi:4-amino-4-deoxy-L-arabinose transferase-like glycosyltransferase
VRVSTTWFGIAGLGIALAGGAALRWTSPRDAGDLRPRPDALEYEETARNLVAGEGYCLIIDGKKYASRYPFGFPVLLAPLLWLADRGPGTGVLLVEAAAAITIAVAWGLGRATGGAAGATVAAMLVALSPLHVRWSRAVMSDVPSTCAIACLLLAGLGATRRGAGPRAWLGLGIGAGLAATLRTTNVLVVLPFALVLASARATRRTHLAALAGGIAFGLAPLLAYQSVRFGSPLGTGYGLWRAAVFAPRFVTGRPAGGGSESNLVVYERLLLGRGDLYPWPAALLAVLGLAEALRGRANRTRLVPVVACLVLALLGVYLPFFWQDPRFLLPALPAVAALAAVPFRPGAPATVRVAASGLAALGLAALWSAGPEAWARGKNFHEFDALAEIARHAEPNAAVVVNTTEPFFARALRDHGADRVWVPLGLDAHQLAIAMNGIRPYGVARTDPGWIERGLVASFDPDRTASVIQRLFDAGRPVYFSTLLAYQVPIMSDLAGALEARFRLEPVAPLWQWQLFRVRPRAD